MAPSRQKPRGLARLVTPCVIFVLAVNVSYQVCRGLWRPQAPPSVARFADPAGGGAAAANEASDGKGGLASNWVGTGTVGAAGAGASAYDVDAHAIVGAVGQQQASGGGGGGGGGSGGSGGSGGGGEGVGSRGLHSSTFHLDLSRF
jgi:hypothetical protein